MQVFAAILRYLPRLRGAPDFNVFNLPSHFGAALFEMQVMDFSREVTFFKMQ